MAAVVAHDNLAQRGGGERVALELWRCFPGSRLITALFEPSQTFPGFLDAPVEVSPLNRFGVLRRHHRLALPLLPFAWNATRVTADLTICSSSGWAHGIRTQGPKVVYCHTPARWLYLHNTHGLAGRALLGPLKRRLVQWDQTAAETADLYLANSSAVAQRIRSVYGREATVIHPPVASELSRARPAPPPGLSEVDGYVLCVSRLLPYKNVDALLAAFRRLSIRLVVVGDGPLRRRLVATAPHNVQFYQTVSDANLAYLYEHASALVAPSYEDFGLTPIEAARFGTPVAALRAGGYLDSVIDGGTGHFFDTLDPAAIADCIQRVAGTTWSTSAIRAHADQFSPRRFRAQLLETLADHGLGSG